MEDDIMPHWSKDPKKKKEVQQKISDALATIDKKKWRMNISNALKGRKTWNTGLSKEQQPRYGKPISEKQRENIRKNGLKNKGRPAWNRGLIEWSPRLHFKKTREEVFDRDNHQCVICHSPKNLLIHHIKYWEELQDWNVIHSMENLEVLCRRCHMQQHTKQKVKMKEGELNE